MDFLPGGSSLNDAIFKINEMILSLDKSTADIKEINRYRANVIEKNIVKTVNDHSGKFLSLNQLYQEFMTVVYGVQAQNGKRLKKVLDDLKNQIISIIETMPSGGGLDVSEQYKLDEIKFAIANVNPEIPDGLKLDYRLRNMHEQIQQASLLQSKSFIIPLKMEKDRLVDVSLQLPSSVEYTFISGIVTVVNHRLETIVLPNDQLLTGTVNDAGLIVFSGLTNEAVYLYVPVMMAFKDLPDNLFDLLNDLALQKSDPLFKDLIELEASLRHVADDLAAMKGVNWTIDHSIMDNFRRTILESISPKGLHVQVQDGVAQIMFSYQDHSNLSHFVLERWDEESQSWEPYDGNEGIVLK